MTPRGRGEHLGQGRRLRRPLASEPRERVVAVVGAGASGTLVAVNLLRLGNVRVMLIDPSENGRGVAYSTRDEHHLLNVPACGMSGLADNPDDVLEWCAGRGMKVGRRDFLPRSLYGDYLQALLARFDQGGRVQIIRARVENVIEPPFHGGVRITLDDASELSADAAVLAVGNAAPSPVRAIAELGSAEIVQDPWSPGELARLRGAERVVIVGTGLSAVDVAMSLAAENPGVRITAVSRHGRLPQAHSTQCTTPRGTRLTPGAPLSEITRILAAELEQEPGAWREVIDALRPVTPALWQGVSGPERERFESELRWWWDIHRHRLAPRAASRLADLVAAGRLQVLAGSVIAVGGGGADGALGVHLSDGRRLTGDAVVNATGPARVSSPSANPLLQRLLGNGRARADVLGVGLATSEQGALINIEGTVSHRCFTLGPPRRGELFESTAIPEIRVQAAALARLLTSTTPVSEPRPEPGTRVNSTNPIGY
jgi:uncharacterized NAD(P)/FAD-binding protein YdhS